MFSLCHTNNQSLINLYGNQIFAQWALKVHSPKNESKKLIGLLLQGLTWDKAKLRLLMFSVRITGLFESVILSALQQSSMFLITFNWKTHKWFIYLFIYFNICDQMCNLCGLRTGPSRWQCWHIQVCHSVSTLLFSSYQVFCCWCSHSSLVEASSECFLDKRILLLFIKWYLAFIKLDLHISRYLCRDLTENRASVCLWHFSWTWRPFSTIILLLLL